MSWDTLIFEKKKEKIYNFFSVDAYKDALLNEKQRDLKKNSSDVCLIQCKWKIFSIYDQ